MHVQKTLLLVRKSLQNVLMSLQIARKSPQIVRKSPHNFRFKHIKEFKNILFQNTVSIIRKIIIFGDNQLPT